MATLRNRRALITRVRPNGSPELHAVDVDYTDVDGRPQECFAMGGEPVVDDLDRHSVDARVAIHSFRCGHQVCVDATRSISAAVPDARLLRPLLIPSSVDVEVALSGVRGAQEVFSAPGEVLNADGFRLENRIAPLTWSWA